MATTTPSSPGKTNAVDAATIKVQHAESGVSAKDAASSAAARGQAATGFEHLTPLQTARTFWKSTSVCFILAFAAAADCYQVA
jgi:hypothetical protein